MRSVNKSVNKNFEDFFHDYGPCGKYFADFINSTGD